MRKVDIQELILRILEEDAQRSFISNYQMYLIHNYLLQENLFSDFGSSALYRMVAEYPDDIWVKAIYIGVLLWMHGLTILIFVLTKKGEEKNQQYLESAKKIFQDAGGNLEYFKDVEWDRVLRITYAVHNPDDIMTMAIKSLPEEYMNLLNELKEDSMNSYRMSIISTIIMALSITLSVVAMMISPFMCYPILSAGLIFTLIAKSVFRKKEKTAKK